MYNDIVNLCYSSTPPLGSRRRLQHDTIIINFFIRLCTVHVGAHMCHKAHMASEVWWASWTTILFRGGPLLSLRYSNRAVSYSNTVL